MKARHIKIFFLAVCLAVFLPLTARAADWLVQNEECDTPACKGSCECKALGGATGTRTFVANKRNLVVFKWWDRVGNWELLLDVLNVKDGGCDVVATQREADTFAVKDNPPSNLFECSFIPPDPSKFKKYCCCAQDAAGQKICRSEIVDDPNECGVPVQEREESTEIFQEKLEYTAEFTPSGNCADLAPKPSPAAPSAPAGGISLEELRKQAAQKLNPMKFSSVPDLIGRAVATLMAFIGSIALVLYIYAGILWMTAQGAAEKIASSKKIMVWTTLGLVIMLGSYMIVSKIFGFFG